MLSLTREQAICVRVLPSGARRLLFLIGAYFLLRGSSAAVYFLLVAPLLLFKAMDLFASEKLLFVFLRWASGYRCGRLFWLRNLCELGKKDSGWRAAAVGDGSRLSRKVASKGRMTCSLSLRTRNWPRCWDIISGMRWSLRPGIPPSTSENRRMSPVNLPFGPPMEISWRPTGLLMNILPSSKRRIPSWAAALSIITHERDAELPQSIRGAFDSVVLFRELPGTEADTRPLYIYLCLVYQTLPL